MTALLEARDLRAEFPAGSGSRGARTIALGGVSLALEGDGEGNGKEPSFTALVGESGSGKTTLARMLLGLARPTSGQVLYRGKDIWNASREERRTYRREVQAVFQDPFEICNPFYKAEHLLTTPVAKFGLAASKKAGRELVENALEAVGLRPEDVLGRFPSDLSGGERQRLAVARVMLIKPRVVVADEPVSMVDASLRATILSQLLKSHRDLGASFLYITHDLATARQVSRRILVLYRGIVVEAGDTDAVVGSPKHPYTMELLRAIPSPDPRRPWKDVPAAAPTGPGAPPREGGGCVYASRCDRALPECSERSPAPVKPEERHAAACHHHQGLPAAPGEKGSAQ
jgi:peptide/nickel transport system ATP-binding protein